MCGDTGARAPVLRCLAAYVVELAVQEGLACAAGRPQASGGRFGRASRARSRFSRMLADVSGCLNKRGPVPTWSECLKLQKSKHSEPKKKVGIAFFFVPFSCFQSETF